MSFMVFCVIGICKTPRPNFFPGGSDGKESASQTGGSKVKHFLAQVCLQKGLLISSFLQWAWLSDNATHVIEHTQ